MQRLLLLSTILFFIFSCDSDKKSDQKNNQAQFADYVSGYTSGMISARSSIRIKLAQSIPDSIQDLENTNSLIRLSPAIQGDVFWEDDYTVVFKPSEDFSSGSEYDGTFLLTKVIEEAADKGDFKFSFKIIPQNYEVTVSGMAVSEQAGKEIVTIEGLLETADNSDPMYTETIVKAVQKGKELPITWTHGANQKMHNFVITEVIREDDAGFVSISWNGQSIGVDKTGDMDYSIPGKNEYGVVSSRVVIGRKNYISVMFSNPLNEKQNLKGFIELGDQSPKYTISGNELKLYPTGSLYGEVNIKLFSKIKSKDGRTLKEDYVSSIQMPQSKPEVRLTGNKGTILPNSEGLILPFEAIGLKAVDVKVIQIFEGNVVQYLQVNNLGKTYQLNRVGRPVIRKSINLMETDVTNLHKWNRFTLNLEDIIKIQPGALYQIDISFRKSQSLFFCGESEVEEDLTLLDENWNSSDESSNWDWYENYYYDDYDWSERNNPCHSTYYRQNRNVSQLVLASDLGIIAKRSDYGNTHVFVSSLVDTKPLSGVKIELYDFQQQVIGAAETNAEGMATVDTKGKPFALVARHGSQYGYLKVDDGSSLSLSNFNVTGQQIQKGIKGYIYGERGVWRPGDDIFLTFVLEDKEKKLPENYPVLLELRNPQGQLVKKMVKNESVSGMFAFKLKTDQEAPTGFWSVNVKAGGAQFRKSLKVESIKPNRLKIDLDFNKERLSALDQSISGDLNVKWLHGAIAGGLEADYELVLSPTKTTFEDYPNHSFDDQSKDFYSERQEVFSGKLDQNGYAKVNVDLIVENNPPGALNATFIGKVYEEGGNFSIDQLTIPYYPYESFVGIKTPEGDRRGMLLTDKDHNIRIATVDANGKPKSVKNVEVELFKLGWRWWWDNSANDVSNYVGRSHGERLQSASINTTNGEGEWKLNIKYPQWGRYYLKVTDPNSGHSAGKVVFVDWPGWAGKGKRGDAGGVSMLNFEIEKGTYNVGEEVKMTVPSSQGGRFLVSLETGRKVISSFWVESTNETTEIPFKATKEMSPNVYAHVTLVQPHAQTANDLPIRMYGVESIKVVDPNTTLSPKMSLPSQLNPEQKFNVQVKEENGRDMAYTIAMVDEGLLDLTRFKTPDPWNTFYAREALGVKTWDVYDDVLGAYGGTIERLLAIGGDGELEEPKAQKANRFKPVVDYLGPFFLEGGKTATHDIQMPQYVGSVRMMLVAAHEGAYGSAEQATPVKQSVMALATLPRVAGPGEEMDLPVTVFASDEKIKSVEVSVKSEGKLSVVGGNTKNLSFDKPGEKVVYFKVKAAEALGIGKVSVSATGGGTTAQYDIELDVRASNPEEVDVLDKLIAANEDWKIGYEPLGLLGTNEAYIELSSLPPLNLEQRLKYLIKYPHGCIEQTTSSVFAQLYLEELAQVSDERKQKIAVNIDAAIERLRKFQTTNGGFSYWPGNYEESDWGTNYAGHFLIEAKKKGYAVPDAMLNDWKKFQKNQANKWSKGGRRHNDLAQAYRLYTLALAGDHKLGAMNRMKEMDGISDLAKWRLALTYAIAGYDGAAQTMIDGLTQEVDEYTEMTFSYGSRIRDRAMILETLSFLDKKEEAFPILKEIAERMGDKNRWMSTQTTAYSLIGIVAYSDGMDTTDPIDFDVNIGSTSSNYETGNYITQIEIDGSDQNTPIEISNNGTTPIYARVIRTGIPLVGQEVADEKNINMTVKYIDNDGNSLSPRKLKQGTDFIAVVSVHHPGIRSNYEEIALTQIFPSGWEIINTRFEGTDANESGDKPEYLDIRDDRALMYFDLRRNERKIFRVRLNATYKGKFYLPAVATEAMYDNTIYARTEGMWVNVVE